MVRSLILVFALALVPVAADAAPKKKELLLQPLMDEMVPTGATATKAQEKAIKRSESCLKQDNNWLRAQRDEAPLNQIYELVGGAVVCWQGAEKKSAAGGEESAPVHWWTSGRARYIETFRSWLWSLDAKLSGDVRHVCKRLDVAVKEGGAAAAASENLAEKYQGAAAKALAHQLSADITALNEAVTSEYANQRCSKQ